METLYAEWVQSRSRGLVLTAYGYHLQADTDPILKANIEEHFQRIIHTNIPCLQTIHFVFLLEGVPISLREQIVRHRIGHKFGNRLGCDTIPSLADSSFWSQGMRILDMTDFFLDNQFYVPESITANVPFNDEAPPPSNDSWTVYKNCMAYIAQAYKQLLDAGIPMEDARQVLPLACTHRMTWSINLAALLHLLSKRGCWIAQLGMWQPIVLGMVRELGDQVHTCFREFVCPPCIKGADDLFQGCLYGVENQEREAARDPYPVCPLWWHKEQQHRGLPDHAQQAFLTRCKLYRKLWNRDPETGVKLDVD